MVASSDQTVEVVERLLGRDDVHAHDHDRLHVHGAEGEEKEKEREKGGGGGRKRWELASSIRV